MLCDLRAAWYLGATTLWGNCQMTLYHADIMNNNWPNNNSFIFFKYA